MMDHWKEFGRPRKVRPLHSVILAQGISNHLVNDFKEFLSHAQWYLDRGIPHRRSYLLYGPPGSGKSSFIEAIAGFMNYSICILNLNERGLTDDKLSVLFSVAPARSIILLEDIDAIVKEKEKGKEYYGVTLSGLLNTLDGVASTEERVVFMTTNHIDRLNPALIRPGRVDMQAHIGWSTPYQLGLMFNKFYPQSNVGNAFVHHLRGSKVSMAAVQGYFMLYKDNPDAVIKNIHLLTQAQPNSFKVSKTSQTQHAKSSDIGLKS